MANNQIVDYVKSELTRGESKESISAALIKVGWSDSDVREAFGAITAQNDSLPAATPVLTANVRITEKKYPITTLWIFKAPIIIILISVIAFLFGYWFPYLIIALPFMLIINPLTILNFHYATEDKFFVVKQGIISKKQRNLPYGVIQNVLVKQDIFDRIFGLAALQVENAAQSGGKITKFDKKQYRQAETVGSSGNKVSIPGMKKRHAEALKKIILQKMKENPIEDSQSGL